MRRLFTFGCSFTYYYWPTWADLLGIDFDLHQNWAQQGLGNQAIAERIAECHVKNNFTEDDTVIVQWSSHLRHDYHNTNWRIYPREFSWKTLGSVFSEENEELYDKKWLDIFFCERSYFMHTLNQILLTQGFLRSTKCRWYMTSMGDLRKLGQDIKYDQESPNKDINEAWKIFPEFQIYEKKIWEDNENWIIPISSIANQYFDLYWAFYNEKDDKEKIVDPHPSIKQHQIWLNDYLRPKLDLKNVTKEQNDLVDSIHKLQKNSDLKPVFLKLLDHGMYDKPINFVYPKPAIGF